MIGSLTLSYLLSGIVLIVMIVYPFRVYNKLVFLSNNTDKAFANIDIWLQQRSEELPSLCAIVRRFNEHEKSTIEQVTQLREKYASSSSQNSEMIIVINALTTILQPLFMRIEDNPDIKADSVYQQVSSRIIRLEEQIEEQREFFNNSVTIFNNEMQRVPVCWLAKVFMFKSKVLLHKITR